MLKFERLQQEKAEVKKKKLRHNFAWEKERHKENQQLQHVLDIQCLPRQPPGEPPQQLPPSRQGEPEHSFTSPSVSELNSARRIDQLLKEGVEWIAHLES